MISCKEVFCAELPSPSSIFLCSSTSYSNNTSNNTNHQLQCGGYQFASERHSLTLQTSYNEQGYGDDKDHDTAPSKKKKNKERTLVVERLQSSSTTDTTASTTATTTCLAHSSLQLKDNVIGSIQAFAIMESSNTNNTTSSSSNSNSNSNSSGSHHDQATTLDTHSGIHDGNTSVGEMIDKKQHARGDNGTSSSAFKYALMIKCRFSVKDEDGESGVTAATATATAATTTERIPLDFRPISVHVTQLYSSSSPAAVVDDGSSPPIIGIFAAGNDNKLHFFIATKQALRQKLCQQDESVATISKKSSSCFQPSFCFETIDPSNVLSNTCAPNNNNDYYDHRLDESVDDNPLMFTTPIMAIDTCISECHEEMVIPSSSYPSPTTATTRDKVNRLAIACYDGVVRILTYTIESDASDANIIRIAMLQFSTLIVDGPITTLHFGKTNTKYYSGRRSSDFDSEEKEADNLFLLVGSLCGLAFLFYEVPTSTTASIEDDNAQTHPSFDGPVIVVDELYDADKEGFEDCVTSVHVMRYHDVLILAVGTQGCRLLLYQQQTFRSTEIETRKERDRNKTTMTAEIENKTQEILYLSSERDKLTKTANNLRQKVLESENIDQDEHVLQGNAIMQNDTVHGNNNGGEDDVKAEQDSVQDEDVLHGDAITQSGGGGENDEDDEKAERVDKGDLSISIAPKVESSKSIEAEIDDVELSCSNCTSLISQLQSSIDNLVGKLNDDLSSPSPQLDSKSVRKMHRYEFLWEHKLPNPIQGIGSAVCNESGELECYITTRQSIHIFRLLSLRMVNAAAASLERKLRVFTNTSKGGEA